MYLEVAEGTPFNRGVPLTKPEMIEKLNPLVPLYRSTYLYDEEGRDWMLKNKSVKGYFGMRYIDHIILDIDKEKNTDILTLNKARAIVMELLDSDVDKNDIGVYFSGTGYHIQLSNKLFGFKGSKDLPFQVKNSIKKAFPSADISILMRSGIYRVQYTINQKTGLHKIPLEMSTFLYGQVKDIFESAKTITEKNNWAFALDGNGELKHLVDFEVPQIREISKKVVEPYKIVPCIQAMLNRGPKEGTRHNVLLRVASHFRRHGIPSDYCKVALLHWNNNNLEEEEILKQVESVYNGGYQYSCIDKLMTAHCQTSCMYFKRKDYTIDVMNSDELQKALVARFTGNFDGRTIDLSKLYGLTGKDVVIYPGELVTIFGPTGASKTTVAQNIALGYNASTDTIDPNATMSTLYLSLELSGWYMHRRNLQIVSGTSKEQIQNNYEAVFEEYKDRVSHINIQTVAPLIPQIQDKIRELNPSLVIVDYIDLVETPKTARGEYEQIKYISHELSKIAVAMDIIIIQLTQISRNYSREQVIDLYAGKGSGAIENASRKVLGLNGRADSIHKTMELLKNTDGDLFETKLRWTPSFRMIKE
jgi:archaellum biogenesis ATPase FlaH